MPSVEGSLVYPGLAGGKNWPHMSYSPDTGLVYLPAKQEPMVYVVDETYDIDTVGINLGVDVCVTACPAPEAQQAALELMAINGRVSFFGGLPKNREVVGLNSNLIHYRQLEVSGTTRQSLIQYRKTLEMIASGLLDVADLVTARLPLDRFEEALAAAGSATGLKTVISM